MFNYIVCHFCPAQVSCIENKLDKSFIQYLLLIHRSTANQLTCMKPKEGKTFRGYVQEEKFHSSYRLDGNETNEYSPIFFWVVLYRTFVWINCSWFVSQYFSNFFKTSAGILSMSLLPRTLVNVLLVSISMLLLLPFATISLLPINKINTFCFLV